ncbi:hypothetical protein JD844_021312 [Phrynosoma platyrhinos]|uniref:Phospholipase A2 n=1 Tax=Phrynosoma platyrhinos TaxID=52577 RepID=A0ABQ7STJ6_PHRPL|nr:hypothetical protein JD844_021312 [Phrynosoma platyrhinos]
MERWKNIRVKKDGSFTAALVAMKREKHPYYDLTVKVLRARNIKGTDLLSKADCYVELRLPTASPITYRTRVIDNSSDPEWNETFHFKIHNAVKNTMELALFDEDVLISDELASLIFDVTGLKAGRPWKETFRLKEAYPCLRLEGVIKKDEASNLREQGSNQFKISVPGAYEKQVYIPCKPESDQNCGVPFVFHIGKEMCSELSVELERTITVQDGVSHDAEEHITVLGSGTVPFHSFPLGKEIDLTVPLGKGLSVDLRVKAEQITGDLDIRLGFDLCKEERGFLEKRKNVVSQALKKTLKLREDPGKDEVPVVAVLGSGGGIRALTSFYGSLFGLQQLNLLDCITYLAGISGTTWCMSMLYQDSEWSCKDLSGAIISARDKISSSKVAAFSSERLKYYFQELNAMENAGRKVSFTDLWGLIVEYFLQQKEDQSKLSDQQEAVKRAQNPYPIYAAVNVMPNISGDDFAVGFRKYGAFVRTEDFDSEFFMGRLIKKHPEPRICYLQGMWGSAFAASLDDVFLKVVGSGLTFLESLGDVVRVIDDCRRFHFRDPMRLKTRMVIPGGLLLQLFQDFFKSRVTAGETFNFMQGLYLHKDYVSLKKFIAWKGTHLDAFPNRLTPMADSLYLVDGGFSINSPFPLMLQPERDVDVILSFNYSWEAPFEVLELTQKYCKEHEIPFPQINVSKEDEDNPKECYVFMDAENPKTPIVLHFPLVNDTFCRYKAPGVERESEEEKSYGDFEVEAKDSPYRTLNFTFESHEFNRLVELMSKADCYVALKLPTASPLLKRTQVVYNSSDPEWNETFEYRIHSAVKACIKEVFLSDVASGADCYVTLWLPTASREKVRTRTVLNSSAPLWNETFYFMIQNQVKVSGQQFCYSLKFQNILELRIYAEDALIEDDLLFTILFDVAEVAPGERIHVTFILNMERMKELEVEFILKENPEQLDMRLGFDLCEEEKAFLHKRKNVVSAALKSILQLKKDLLDHEVPVVAVMAAGGGCRAMTSLYGQLSGLKKLGILDCITYISGTSGSSWYSCQGNKYVSFAMKCLLIVSKLFYYNPLFRTMSNLYEDSAWSQKDLGRPICKAKKHMTKNKINVFSLENLINYQKEMMQRAEDGISTSFNDLWAVALENILHGKVNDFKLSDQQQAVNQGQNPLPLYVALSVKENHISTFDFKEWCEFSPYEVGFLKYGAFIHSEDFGSDFFMGRLMRKIPESRLCYLEALWSNILAVNLLDVWNCLSSTDQSWQKLIRSKIRNIDRKKKGERRVRKDREKENEYDDNELKDRIDSRLDQFPNQLTPSEDDICLVDAAYFINTSCPPFLRKERKVDVMLSFDYTPDNPFQSIEQTQKYCLEQGIPFPRILLCEEDMKNPRECYLFVDDENRKAPIVLHFPLVNDTFQKFKEPGVERVRYERTVPLSGHCSPYHLMNFRYSEKDFDALLKLNDYNIRNNRDKILEAFSLAIEWKKCDRQ